ncbi:hypothetical protein F511_29521 [Dorcoceras hygrometricum]|uniref:Myb-like domain-containing protein n=1 Tax=Dorcoceras hygrometricum TaxID=472368 RepID=A0A2Z7CZJ2_9LAMI|nr:hypothetical protein F511_29521 [Dorcoceras hygrometricum]
MPERKLRKREENPTIALRRSPRFLHANRTDALDPGTQNLELTKVRYQDQFSTPPDLFVAKSLQECGNSVTGRSKISAKSRKASDLFVAKSLHECGNSITARSKISAKSRKASERPAELDGGADEGKNETIKGLQKVYLMEKRVTRSSAHGSKNIDNRGNGCFSGEDSSEKVRDLRKEVNLEVEKRVTRSSSRKIVTEKVEKAKDASAKHLDKSDGKKSFFQRRSANENCPRKMENGKKRKRGQAEEECELVQGWNKEQDMALRRAYFTAKPTPHFWKKVARMVPGKSAQECLDRIHSEQLTPPQPRTRSRTNRNEPSSLSFSSSELLGPAKTKRKSFKQRKRKSVVAQKMVRQLLQKQQKEDQDYEADLFSVLEPKTDSPSLKFLDSLAFSTPLPNLGPGVLTRFRETSSSTPKKQFSKSKTSVRPDFASPPVLKPIKNMARHERYIDQLHCRDAKRKAESLRNARSIHGRSDKNSGLLEVNLVKAAKDALIFEAQDAINQFRSQQSSMLHDKIDDNSSESGEDASYDEFL